jgi:hypothetical protein
MDNLVIADVLNKPSPLLVITVYSAKLMEAVLFGIPKEMVEDMWVLTLSATEK